MEIVVFKVYCKINFVIFKFILVLFVWNDAYNFFFFFSCLLLANHKVLADFKPTKLLVFDDLLADTRSNK